jgi:hypothetical protein
MTAPFDYEALWMKAKLFLNRAMDDDGSRAFDEQAHWAALALELLAKAALARVSPLLIADPTEDGASLLIAAGLLQGDARFTTVRAKTLFARCAKAFKPFSLEEASHITNARNDYLHGAAAGFTSIPPAAWWPRYWSQAVILVAALDREVSELVGDREAIVSGHLERNTKNVEHRVETLIGRAIQRLEQHRSGTLPARIDAEWSADRDLGIRLLHHAYVTCPACGDRGTLEGRDVTDITSQWVIMSEDEAYDEFTLTVASEYFSCSTCLLVLDGYQYLRQAGLPDRFRVVGTEWALYKSEHGDN